MSNNARKAIEVMIVDDHTLFAEGTVSLLAVEPRISTVSIAKNGVECLELMNTFVPDVVLLDIQLPDVNGTDLIDEIKKIRSEAKIIMMTGYNPKGYITKSIRKGANGFLLKDCSAKEMILAILRVYDSGNYFSRGLEDYLHQENDSNNLDLNDINSETSSKSLTPKEVEIIELVSKGLHNKGIAESLGINVRTVESHVYNIISKLGVSNRFEAVLYWANIDKFSKR